MTQTLPTWAGACPLPHLGIIRAQGADAAHFIHSQLSQDFEQLTPQQARLAAFCNAKGRMQASFIGLRPQADVVLLILSRDLLARTLKRLSLFVLRAQVKLSDATADYHLWGLLGSSALPFAAEPAPWTVQPQGAAQVVQLYPAQGLARALYLAPVDGPAPTAPALDMAIWRWAEVMSGVATLTEAVYEQFVPQMLNYESVGGVNFKKGCYPGQEIVARSQFRGTLKRRALLAFATAPLQAGQEIFTADCPDQPVGLVVQAAPCPPGVQPAGYQAIVSMQLAATTGQALRLGASDGPELTLQAMPYALLEDI